MIPPPALEYRVDGTEKVETTHQPLTGGFLQAFPEESPRREEAGKR